MDFEDDLFGGPGFSELEIGRVVKIYLNGQFTSPKDFSFQHHWSWDEFLCMASQRLELIPKAQRVFNANGTEIQDIVHVEDDDMLFFSTGEDFAPPEILSNVDMSAESQRNDESCDAQPSSNELGAGGGELAGGEGDSESYQGG